MKITDVLRLLFLSIIWGASFLFMRLVVPEIGVISTAFFRELLGVFGLVVVLVISRANWNFDGKLHHSLVLGMLNSAAPFILYSLAALVLPAGYSAIFNATTPLMGVILGTLFFDEQLSWRKSAGVVMGVLGVSVLTGIGPVVFGVAEILGALACLLSAACYGLAGFLTQRWIYKNGGLDSKLLAFGSQSGAIILMIPIFGYSLWTSGADIPAHFDTWLMLFGLGFGCSTVAYILYFRLISDIGPVRTMSVTFLVPVFGVLFGAVFLEESLSIAHLMGGSMIALALLLVLRPVRSVKAEQYRSVEYIG